MLGRGILRGSALWEQGQQGSSSRVGQKWAPCLVQSSSLLKFGGSAVSMLAPVGCSGESGPRCLDILLACQSCTAACIAAKAVLPPRRYAHLMTVRLNWPTWVLPMMSMQVVGLSLTTTFILMVIPCAATQTTDTHSRTQRGAASEACSVLGTWLSQPHDSCDMTHPF